jgi:methylase of polypeptide subunit release factors
VVRCKLGLSRKRKLPVFYILGQTFLPHEALRFIFLSKWLKILYEDDESIKVEIFGNKLTLLPNYAITLISEWRIWERCYLPDFTLSGKTVLDIGAGCGETALFYILHGAEKVIAIEPEAKAVKCLEENVLENKWTVEIIPEPFNLKHLKFNHDFMKMDAEGCEKELLHLSKFKPCIVEVHNTKLKKKFEERGFRKIYSFKNGIYLMKYA